MQYIQRINILRGVNKNISIIRNAVYKHDYSSAKLV